ncbi:hypothetical protein [Paenibacillus turpanensis]|uniref:hypothetical protein n=1 Tax=Paenibacillus turpanensis TaxID=2689078 RepID=UPI00140DD44A|nr:hypothetical protein [Paenibacillus turpanensis]
MQNQPVQGSSYQQFMQQVQNRREIEMQQAQQAILQAGADNASQQMRNIVQMLSQIGQEIAQAQKQLHEQMQAQQRQLQQLEQRVTSACQQLADVAQIPMPQAAPMSSDARQSGYSAQAQAGYASSEQPTSSYTSSVPSQAAYSGGSPVQSSYTGGSPVQSTYTGNRPVQQQGYMQ